jgi:ADP-ribosyl-[dinitrogen reductase] hydrolase
MQRPLANSYWVRPGLLLAGEHPVSLDGRDTEKRLQRLLTAGINGFVDLTQPGELPDYRALLPAGVDYWRSAIADASVPQDPEQMRAIQAYIRSALERGRRLYVHCRAGIGRTGIVTGCYLAEQGLDGAAALKELNRLWGQSERAASWPQVPQTEQQADYIRGWRPQRLAADAIELSPLQSLRRRFLGALSGLAVGDALAAATQFRRAGTFTPVAAVLGGGPFDLPRGAWSDDTAMALCLADSLLACGGFDRDDQITRLQRWQQQGEFSATGQCVGITAATARILAGAPGGRAAAVSDEAALARIAPAVMYGFGDELTAVTLAAEAAALTAPTVETVDCCRLFAAMLHAALRGAVRARVLSLPRRVFGSHPLQRRVAALAQSEPVEPASLPTGAGPLRLLAAVRWAFASSPDFRAGALRLANFGGDSDIATAAYGALAGAHYGVGGIPAPWLAELAQREQIEGYADRLLTGAVVGLSDVEQR